MVLSEELYASRLDSSMPGRAGERRLDAMPGGMDVMPGGMDARPGGLGAMPGGMDAMPLAFL